MNARRTVAAFALLISIAGCGSAPAPSASAALAPVLPNAPAEVVNREPLPLCGMEKTTQTAGFDVAGRTCFWNAYRSRSPAEFITTEPTIEGDPVTSVYRVLADGRVVVFVDTTYDMSGPSPPPRWIRLDCPGLSLIEGAPGQPAFGPSLGPEPGQICVETSIP